VGKDLGYAITEKAYSNFHFKIDFKWGERRWAPAQKRKEMQVCVITFPE
jgi:hypothetical protein